MNQSGGEGAASQGEAVGKLSRTGARQSWPGRSVAVAAMEGVEKEKRSGEREEKRGLSEAWGPARLG